MAEISDADGMYAICAEALLAGAPVSRNRHFAAFQDPRTARALALYRRLRALIADLEDAQQRGGHLRVHEVVHGGRPNIELVLVGRARRTTWLERPAWELLLRHSGAARALAQLLDPHDWARVARVSG